MERRRALLMMPHGIDTSPKIAEYGKACAFATTGEREQSNACITEWYSFAPPTEGVLTIYYHMESGYPRNDGNYQFYATKTSDSGINRDWFYNISSSTMQRKIGWATSILQEIRFTILVANIDNNYAYVVETGQIFFAGKNTPYYGHRNTSELN